MQVKCLYEPQVPVYYMRALDRIIKDKDNEWSNSLNTFSDGRGIPIGFPERRQSSELYILGGRGSIVDWLRVQGPKPVIYAQTAGTTLHVYVLRKQRLFDKNLTTLLISPQGPDDVAMNMRNSGWDLKFTGSSTAPYTTPGELANVVERGLADGGH